jgi:hypothetical protein
MKSLACCSPVLLKIPLSQLELIVKTSRMLFQYLSAVTESSRSFRTIVRQIDTDNSVCCDSCLRDNWGSSSTFDSLNIFFSTNFGSSTSAEHCHFLEMCGVCDPSSALIVITSRANRSKLCVQKKVKISVDVTTSRVMGNCNSITDTDHQQN